MRSVRHIVAVIVATTLVVITVPTSAWALRDAVPTTGVNQPGVWWNASLMGNGASIGVLGDHWNYNHVWLAGHTVETAPNQTNPSGTAHGSATVSVVASPTT